ncbi:MAG: transcription termination/antitermination protein NusA [Parcubacteria group bacterium]|nr:transcription termination/antitermination protein NusA [Parcubacteria group bacterium]
MIDIKNLTVLLDQIAEEKGLKKERVMEAIEQAIAAAYKKEYGQRGQAIKAKLNTKTGNVEFWQEKLVVAKDMIYSDEELEQMKEAREKGEPRQEPSEEKEKIRFNPERHIMLADAKKEKAGVDVGDELEFKLEPKEDYGRIAAQTAKQVVLQKIREAERETVLAEFRSKEGELISGLVQRVEPRMVFFDLGKTVGILPREEQVPGEFYRPGQRLKLYVMRVEDSPKGPTIFISRAHPKLVTKLFELEVPEIGVGSVEIKAIAREPGSRSKVAVDSHADGVDPVGSMVGQRGTRVSAVINELGGEKIDIIEWADDPDDFISHALSPAKVLQVELQDKNRAKAVVAEDQLSLAIGREGQNVRLAAKLTGWKIDVRTPEGKGIGADLPAQAGEKKPEEEESEEIEKESGR